MQHAREGRLLWHEAGNTMLAVPTPRLRQVLQLKDVQTLSNSPTKRVACDVFSRAVQNRERRRLRPIRTIRGTEK